ncbi:MAG: host attachment family protein [Micropepsaceae bacterium]
MTTKLTHNSLVVVADGTSARFFRNSGDAGKISLKADGEFKPKHLTGEGPAGKSPAESSHHETDEATFAKQLANELNRRANDGDFAILALIADPQTLGQMRPSLHKQVQARLVAEIGKTLTNSAPADIEKALNAAA